MAYADSLKHQLMDPLNASIKDMEGQRRALVDEVSGLEKDLGEAIGNVRKARKFFDQCSRDMIEQKINLEKILSRKQLGRNLEAEKQISRAKISEEKLLTAKATFRQQEETHKALHAKIYTTELPRIMAVPFYSTLLLLN